MKNALIENDYNWKKVTLRIITLIILVCFTIEIMEDRQALQSWPELVMYIIYILLTFRIVFWKKARTSMCVMKNFCGYKEIQDLLEGEKFERLKDAGSGKIERSLNWMKINGVFIPKRFILGGMVSETVKHNEELILLLINGEIIIYTLGYRSAHSQSAKIKVTGSIPYFCLLNEHDFKRLQKEVKQHYHNNLENKFKLEEMVINRMIYIDSKTKSLKVIDK